MTRQALNHLRAVRVRRAECVGTWLSGPARTEQIAHSARRHVHARRRRFEPASDTTGEIVRRFLFPFGHPGAGQRAGQLAAR